MVLNSFIVHMSLIQGEIDNKNCAFFAKIFFNRIALYLLYMIGMELQDNRGSGSGKRLHRELVWQHSSRHDQHACAGQVLLKAYLKA